MNLSTLIRELKASPNTFHWRFEAAGPTVRRDYLQDPYDLWNNIHQIPEPGNLVTYPAMCLSPLQSATIDGSVTRYRFILYAADQLLEDRSNYVFALDAAEYIIRHWTREVEKFDDVLGVSLGELEPFTQKFADELAGYYTTVEIALESGIDEC